MNVEDMISSWSGNTTLPAADTSKSDLDKSGDQSEIFYHQNEKPLATSSKIIESAKDNTKCVTFNTISYDNTLVRSAYEWAASRKN